MVPQVEPIFATKIFYFYSFKTNFDSFGSIKMTRPPFYSPKTLVFLQISIPEANYSSFESKREIITIFLQKDLLRS